MPSPFVANCLQGRVALVTGGGSGICFEIVRHFVQLGCRGVVICGRREAFLADATARLNTGTTTTNTTTTTEAADQRDSDDTAGSTGRLVVEYHVCDVRSPQACQDTVAYVRRRFGRLDILVNGAAGNFLAPASALSYKGFQTVMAIDALGTFHMSRAAYDLLAETASCAAVHDGHETKSQATTRAGKTALADVCIINISATLQYGATWWQAHASAAKAAVDSLTRSLALEWGQSDTIRVNGIAPGPIANTPGMTKLAPGMSPDEMNRLLSSSIPLKRLGKASDIAEAAVYLCLASYVTGHVLVVDGGEWLYKEPRVPLEMVTTLSRDVEARSRTQAPPQSKL